MAGSKAAAEAAAAAAAAAAEAVEPEEVVDLTDQGSLKRHVDMLVEDYFLEAPAALSPPVAASSSSSGSSGSGFAFGGLQLEEDVFFSNVRLGLGALAVCLSALTFWWPHHTGHDPRQAGTTMALAAAFFVANGLLQAWVVYHTFFTDALFVVDPRASRDQLAAAEKEEQAEAAAASASSSSSSAAAASGDGHPSSSSSADDTTTTTTTTAGATPTTAAAAGGETPAELAQRTRLMRATARALLDRGLVRVASSMQPSEYTYELTLVGNGKAPRSVSAQAEVTAFYDKEGRLAKGPVVDFIEDTIVKFLADAKRD